MTIMPENDKMRIMLDADASIKLTKIGLIEILASGFEIAITDVVYDEHVIAGIKRNYPDAIQMKRLVLEGKIDVVPIKDKASAYDSLNLGRGEISIIKYCLENDVEVIVSDDAAFLRIIKAMDKVPCIPIAGILTMGIYKGLIDKDKGLKFLESLRPMIKQQHYFYAKTKIEGLE
jgi:predicted nucleic acid-binding protein